MYVSLPYLNLEILEINADDKKGMFSNELKELLPQVIRSWQVIAVTIAIVLYICLVNYVARTHHRPNFVSKTKPKKAKAKPAPKPAEEEDIELFTEE